MYIRILSAIALATLLAGCPSGGKGSGDGAAGAGACVNGKVDLSKISGDWISAAPLDDRDGKIPGDQYRVRFNTPGADGKFKAILAWRLDSRPFNGELSTNALGQKIRLEEDLPAEVIAQLRAQNNQDPNIPMRAVLEITPAETNCQLDVNDNYQSFMGEKTIEKTAMGALKLTQYKGTTALSFVRCDAPKTIYFNGKAENEQGLPRVNIAADQPVTIRSSAAASLLPKECSAFAGDVFVDGKLHKEKVAGTLGKEKSEDDKGKPTEIDAVIFETQITVPQGATHPVELHIYGECGEPKQRKLVASLCNYAQTR